MFWKESNFHFYTPVFLSYLYKKRQPPLLIQNKKLDQKPDILLWQQMLWSHEALLLLDWKSNNTNMIFKGIVQYNVLFGQLITPIDT